MTTRYGIVVNTDPIPEKNIRAFVLDVDLLLDTGFPITRPIDDMAFNLPASAHNIEVSVRKNLERRYSRPLNFGDCISWDPENVMENRHRQFVVTRFEREVKLFACRSFNGKNQLLLEGAINPSNPQHLFTEYVHAIPIPKEKQGDAWPNIFYMTWITFTCDDFGKLDVDFGGFHAVCNAERQLDIAAVPWNKGSPKYALAFPDSDSEDDGYGGFGHMIANKKPLPDKPLLEVYGREATVTSERTVYMWEFPNVKAVLPFRCPGVEVGVLYLVDAYWNEYEKMYLVSRLRRSGKNELVKSSNGRLRISVKANENVLGVFDSDFGPIDDPDGILALLHLSKYRRCSIPVLIDDRCPSKHGQFRFSIVNIYGDNKVKYEKWKTSAPIELDGVSGVVFEERKAFSSDHYPLVFRFHSEDTPPEIGSRIVMTAEFIPDREEYGIVKWRLDQRSSPMTWVTRKTDPAHPTEEQNVFSVVGKPPLHQKLNEILWTKEFGLVDDNLGLITFDKKDPRKEYSVWVARSPHSDAMPARTVFHVVGVGENAPSDCNTIKVREDISPEELEMQHAFQELVREQIEEQRSQRAESVSSFGSSVQPEGSERFSVPEETFAVPETVHSRFGDMESVSSRASTLKASSLASFRVESEISNTNVVNSDTNVVDFSNNVAPIMAQGDDNRSMTGSLMTEKGGVDPKRLRESRKRVVQPFTGPVYLPAHSERRYDIIETLSRLKYSVNHSSDCQIQCSADCPWMSKVAHLVVSVKGFWEETKTYFPSIANVLDRCLNLQH